MLSTKLSRPVEFAAFATLVYFSPGFCNPADLNWHKPGLWALLVVAVLLQVAHFDNVRAEAAHQWKGLRERYVKLRVAWVNSPFATEGEKAAAARRGELRQPAAELAVA